MQVSNKGIKDFWQENPCGENLVSRDTDWKEFFERYDRFRYETEGHILGELEALDLKGKRVLEIGIGQASDSIQIAQRGGQWSGLDLTEAAVSRAKKRFGILGLDYDGVKQGSAISIPYPENSFDVVYSHGVLHHIPDITKAIEEIARVLRDDGKLVIMLYHKNSLNYYLSICVLRRIFMIGLYMIAALGGRKLIVSDVFSGHLKNAKEEGLLNYLQNPRFLWANTDGPSNPYSKIYDKALIEKEFPLFEIEMLRCHFLNLRHLPILNFLPGSVKTWLESKYGWHLWATFSPKESTQRNLS